MKRSQPKRCWDDARAKVDGSLCRVESTADSCEGPIEAAHVLGRRYDFADPRSTPSKLYVNPDRIVPLCRKHHRIYDAHALDLLGWLLRDEEVQAVRDAGLENARVRLAPSQYECRRVA